MRFIILVLFFNIFLFATTNKKILILNSYHKGFELGDRIINNIEKEFYNYDNIDINILYMDSKRIYSREYIKELTELYSLQLKNRNYDLVITIDRFAYNLAVKNFKTITNDNPLLFVGIEQYSQELLRIYNIYPKVHGILQKHPIEENIKLALKFMPKLKKLYILNDRSPSGNDTSPFILKAMNKYKSKIKIEYLRDDSLPEFKKYFSKYKKDEAILFVRYSNDLNGKYYKSQEIAHAIDAFKLPVFVTDNLFIQKGAMGGKLIPINSLGTSAAKKALKILNTKSKKANISTHEELKYIFDQEKLKQFNLKVPKGIGTYEIINKPSTFFDKHRKFIDLVFMATPFLLVIIFWLTRILFEKQLNAKKLKQRIEFDKTLLNAVDSAIFWQDEEGEILDANVQFCDLIHTPYEQVLGEKLQYIHENLRIKKVIACLNDLKEGKLINSQMIITGNNLKKIYFIKQTRYQADSSSGIVTIFTDITQEKEIEEEKVKHTQYMIQQSKLAEIGEIFSSIAHQWKSPLVEITALAQDMFYSSNSSQKEEDSYHINNIMIQSNYMTDTINDFQDFIMPSKEKTVFDVHETIKAMLNIVKHNMKYNYIDIIINVKKSTSLDVYGYENEFMQAILNIINNAKDALLVNSEKNRNITINLYNKRGNLIIDIIDNGPGISKELVDKIFIQYYSTKADGHGIGLYMTKLIIEDKLDGEIHYKRINEGSCFRIELNTK